MILLVFLGVKYTPLAEYFPFKELDLWSRDGVSDMANGNVFSVYLFVAEIPSSVVEKTY